MNILIEGIKCDLKLEPRVVKSISKEKVTLDDIICLLTENEDLLGRLKDSTFLIEGKICMVSGYKCENRIEVEFANNPKNVKMIKVE